MAADYRGLMKSPFLSLFRGSGRCHVGAPPFHAYATADFFFLCIAVHVHVFEAKNDPLQRIWPISGHPPVLFFQDYDAA